MTEKKPAVLVTGGARRIGRAVAEVLAARGFRVLVHARKPDDADAVALAEQLGGVALFADLAEPLGPAKLFSDAVRVAPELAFLVNNAAVFSTAAELPSAEAAALRAVNVTAPEKLTTLLALRLLENAFTLPRHGAVVDLLDCRIVPSLSGGDHPAPRSPYFQSKLDLAVLMRKQAGMFAGSLRVNGVAPGPVLVPADAVNREKGGEILLDARPTPEDVAGAVGFLLSAGGVTGQILCVDSGQSLL